MKPRTTCPCRHELPPDPEVIGIQYGLRDEVLGVAYNCAVGSTHMLPWAETSGELRRRASDVEMDRIRRGGGA